MELKSGEYGGRWRKVAPVTSMAGLTPCRFMTGQVIGNDNVAGF
jgi:hypothetical protein